MASYHLTIQNKIIEILGKIKKIDGFNSDPVLITKKFLDITAISSFPAISVMRGMYVTQPINDAKTLFRTSVVFAIVGYVKVAKDGPEGSLLNDTSDALEEDIREVLYQNEEALLIDTEAESMWINEGEAILSDEDHTGMIMIMLRFDYVHNSNV